MSLLSKLFSTANERKIRSYAHRVRRINELEPKYKAMDDQTLRAQSDVLRQKVEAGAHDDQILHDAFAVVREAARRVLGMRHFDVQLIGGMVLHEGNIAEMRTGEGKTLVATLPSYLNALVGKSVYVVTVNDFLANRDAEWMGQVLKFLNLSVGVIQSGQDPEQKKKAYGADVIYGTNNEFGFDYLRDHMIYSPEDQVQRSLDFAIVDEVDSILIDEARTPLIISQADDRSSVHYHKVHPLIKKLQKKQDEDDQGDFTLDEKSRQAYLTESGIERVEASLKSTRLMSEASSLYDPQNASWLHHIQAALRAEHLYTRDTDYIVDQGQVVIVDEFTGRLMPGRRWGDGLHQALEVKEGVTVQHESKTLASTTFQNYFRLFDKLAGMTGTASTEAEEFAQIYQLQVVEVPTNQAMIRQDHADLIYGTVREKFDAVVQTIQEAHDKGQPVLVGTASIEMSEHVSQRLKKAQLAHSVLNAKHHAQEAKIIAAAGMPAAITIATNIAGRGTDIVLGGSIPMRSDYANETEYLHDQKQWHERHEQVVACGGLLVLGTERHESRRIDNQLRGRSGRQGDPGESCFFLSLEDSLLRLFASEKMSALMQKLGLKEGEVITHKWVSKAIENAQRKIEGRNFDIRKQLLEYDDIINEQRRVVYELRESMITSETAWARLASVEDEVVSKLLTEIETLEDGAIDLESLSKRLQEKFMLELDAVALKRAQRSSQEAIKSLILKQMVAQREQRMASIPESLRQRVVQMVMLIALDRLWREHLSNVEYLRMSVGLRGYAQRNPKQEYKADSFNLFSVMLDQVRLRVVEHMARIKPSLEQSEHEMSSSGWQYHRSMADQQGVEAQLSNKGRVSIAQRQPQPQGTTFVRQGQKLGRNDPCHCGSGKKYKHCHGKV